MYVQEGNGGHVHGEERPHVEQKHREEAGEGLCGEKSILLRLSRAVLTRSPERR